MTAIWNVCLLQSVLKKNGLYTVRARSDPLDASSPYVTTSIPMVMRIPQYRMQQTRALDTDLYCVVHPGSHAHA